MTISLNAHEIDRRAQSIKLLLMDCDGVLTDGRITLVGEADEQKSFHTRDGHALVLWHRAGLRSGIISGNSSSSVERRARDLKIEFVRQGSHNKIEVFDEILKSARVEAREVAYIGDDVVDIPLIRQSGLGIAVADAVEEVRLFAHLTTDARGGFGAVRESVEFLLKAQGRWTGLMRRYTE